MPQNSKFRTRKPDFLVCGGQRCGSTFFTAAIDHHPDILIAKPLRPEPKFFLKPAGQREFDQYCKHYFGDADRNHFLGEKSTSYLDTEDAPNRIHHFLDSAKLFFLFRNPIERAVSNYLFSKANGMETQTFDDAIALENVRLKDKRFATSVHPHGYAKRGLYAASISRFLQLFDVKQMHFIIFDDLLKDEQGTLNQAFEFLGASGRRIARKGSNIARNSSSWSDFKISPETLDHLLGLFSESNAQLGELIGKDLSHWNKPSQSIVNAMAGRN